MSPADGHAWLVERVAAHAGATPTHCAIKDGTRALDYASLWRQARAFAAHLGALGIERGDRVALILPNGIEAVVATYGSWLAGAAVVPLNAQAKARDFEPWLRHAGARVVVHDGAHRDARLALQALPEPPAILVTGDDAHEADARWNAALAAANEPIAVEVDAAALALILYTSGTTGRPKGVMLSHANLAANVQSIVAYLGLGADDSIVSVLPFYYSYGASVLHTHLAVGARVVLESNTVFPHLVVEAIARERASGFSGVPSTFLLLLNRVPLADHDLSSLRYLTQAGGAMAPTVTARLRAALPQVRLFVMYGQTEATARLAWLPPERLDDKPGSAGIPVAGVEFEIRDEHGTRLAPGEVGEVCVRGPNVMLGYWQDPQLSAEVLHHGWLKTGDMGHLDEEGFLFLSGRRSDMIKTGAHRVHPKDIEEVIAELAEVGEVAVIGIDDELLGQVIKAFVVAADGAGIVPDRIKAHCRERLAIYKIPKHIEVVEALPKTASGKVRRAELGTHSTPGEIT